MGKTKLDNTGINKITETQIQICKSKSGLVS
jgi:hypothetical protein